MLAGRDGQVPAELVAVRGAIVDAANPLTAINWLRTGAAAPILASIAHGDTALSHEALDSHPSRRSADYLRAMLVTHKALPPRDEPLARLERAVADLLAEVEDLNDRRTLTAYATWRILHRARRRSQQRPTTTTTIGHAKLNLRAAVALLNWMRANAIQLDTLVQADVDQWLLTGPVTLRREVADFLGWTWYRRLTRKLTVTRLTNQAGPAASEADYQRLAHTLLHDDGIAVVDRVAGSFALLYGQQLSRIAAMTRDQISDHGSTMTVRFGTTDIEIPEPLAGFVRSHLNTPRRHASLGATDGNWLFPGHLPGRSITPARLGDRLGRCGIDSRACHRAAMRQHTVTAAEWAHTAGGDWSNYAAEIARDRLAPTDRTS